MNNLRLFIIAEPNESGKSLFSTKLTESDYTVFDGDKHLTEFTKKYPEIGSDVLLNAVDEQVFKVEKLKAITEQKSYAFETNFSSSNSMETANEFRHAGYEIHLIFMGLNSNEESIQRVEHRVRPFLRNFYFTLLLQVITYCNDRAEYTLPFFHLRTITGS